MDNQELGKKYLIHSYKHDGTIHRSWDEAILLEENDQYTIFGNDRTLVQESDGRTWKTKEPAVIYFYKNRWFNIISQKKDDGIYYYCNLASPYIIEDNAVKYIDYDLDLRVFADGSYKVLDKSEYKYHKEKMQYPKEIDRIINEELKDLISMAKNKEGPFNKDIIMEYYEKYNLLKQN